MVPFHRLRVFLKNILAPSVDGGLLTGRRNYLIMVLSVAALEAVCFLSTLVAQWLKSLAKCSFFNYLIHILLCAERSLEASCTCSKSELFQWKHWIPLLVCVCVWRKNVWTRYWGIFIWSWYPHRIENFIFSSSISKMDLQSLANIFGSKHLSMCILHSLLLGFLLARRVMPKTAPMMLFYCGVLLKGCLLSFLQKPKILFSGEKNLPHGFLCHGKDVLVGSATAGLASALHSPAF